MRHKVKNNHLGRKSAHRKALLSHLACDLINNKRIVTTLAKAKALRVYVEPIITKSKTNTTHQRRNVFSKLQDKHAVAELFGDVSAKIGNRPGGYTRIIKLGARLGDAAEMAMIELVDYNTIYSNDKDSSPKKKRTRRSGARKKTTSETATTDNVSEDKKEETKSETSTTVNTSENKEEETKSEAAADDKKEVKEENKPEAAASDDVSNDKNEAKEDENKDVENASNDVKEAKNEASDSEESSEEKKKED